MSLIMLLQLIQKRNPDLLAEWLTLSDFTIPPEVYLDQPDYWKGWVYTQHKVNKNVLEYLKKHYPDEDQKVWVKAGKSNFASTRLYAGCGASALSGLRFGHIL